MNRLSERIAAASFTPEEIREHFPSPPLREVAFEIRFAPKLRISAEAWKLQEFLASSYPTVSQEAMMSPEGNSVLTTHDFVTPSRSKLFRLTQSSLGFITFTYPGFKPFCEEALRVAAKCCELYGLSTLARVGLRYNNNVLIPGGDRRRLLSFVRPFIDADRLPLDDCEQFVTEARLRLPAAQATIRTAMFSLPASAYVLDVDCFTEEAVSPDRLAALIETFHVTAKYVFLDHVTPELKQIFRKK